LAARSRKTIVSRQSRIAGSLLGGAVGDALGAGVELLTLDEIRALYGPRGIDGFVKAYGRLGAITDDTQMTLFTAEGLIRAWVRQEQRGICHPPSVIHHAYLRWLLTQEEEPARKEIVIATDGWLFGLGALHRYRAPGTTCLGALRAAEGLGAPAVARNDSKGCGGVMRVAPVGLLAEMIGDDATVFALARDAAALTHGHPAGSLSAGHLAVTIAALLRNETLVRALDIAGAELRRHGHHETVARAVDGARDLAARGRPSPELIEGLGGGWVAEEALAIAVCCALTATDFRDGVLRAVNHSGDSDSTGSLAGNLLGASLGIEQVPVTWLNHLELRQPIERLARDLEAIVGGTMPANEAAERYPGS
jgi:ADP-ribosylglycohydrolase